MTDYNEKARSEQEEVAASDYERFKAKSDLHAALLDAEGRALAAEAERDAAIARIALLVEALEPFREKLLRKERGPWHHGFGCPAEHDGSDNAACTCGAWAAIDRLDAALARAKEDGR